MVGCDEVASSAIRWKGSATLGMPLRIEVVANVPSGIGSMVRKPGVATLIHCSRGSLALILWRQETLGDWDVVQNQCPELAVGVDEHLGLQYLV